MHTFSLSVTKRKKIAALIINTAIVIMEIIGFSTSIRTHGASLVQYYTEDSNMLALAACALYAVYLAISMKDDTAAVPGWVKKIKYMATCCLTLTFVVVIFILSPMAGEGGYKMMLFSGSMLYHHLLCPIAALLSFIFLEEGPLYSRRNTYAAMVPTLIYASVVLFLNLIKVMEGPYPFLRVYEQPIYMSIIWFVVILGGAYAMGWLILLINNKTSARALETKTKTA